MVALPSWLRSHLSASAQKVLPILSGVGSSPGPRMREVINSCRNVSAILWNPVKRHDETENCFLGHPVSFNFAVPIELFGKCLYPSECWLCSVCFCDLVTPAIQLIFQKSQFHQSIFRAWGLRYPAQKALQCAAILTVQISSSLNAMRGACTVREESWVPQKSKTWLCKDLLEPASRGYEPGKGSHRGKPPQRASTTTTKQTSSKATRVHGMLKGGWAISFPAFFTLVVWQAQPARSPQGIGSGQDCCRLNHVQEEEWRDCGDEGVAEQDWWASRSSYHSKPREGPLLVVEAQSWGFLWEVHCKTNPISAPNLRAAEFWACSKARLLQLKGHRLILLGRNEVMSAVPGVI